MATHSSCHPPIVLKTQHHHRDHTFFSSTVRVPGTLLVYGVQDMSRSSSWHTSGQIPPGLIGAKQIVVISNSVYLEMEMEMGTITEKMATSPRGLHLDVELELEHEWFLVLY